MNQLKLSDSERHGDLTYINQVNQFIPEAERFAILKSRKQPENYTRLFIEEMDRLTREAGIRNI